MATEDFTKYLGTEVKFVDRPFLNQETLKHIEYHIQGRITDITLSVDERHQFSIDDGEFYFFSEVEFLSEFIGQPNVNVRNKLGTLAATN